MVQGQGQITPIYPKYAKCSRTPIYYTTDNKRRTLVETAKRWPRPLNRGVSFHSSLRRLIGGVCLIGDCLMEAQLYHKDGIASEQLFYSV